MDGIELMRAETEIDRAMSNTLALCKKHKMQKPSDSQTKLMEDIARTFFHEILKAGQQNSIPLPGKDDFAFFFFKNNQRASLKSIRFVIVEKYLESLIQKFYGNLVYDSAPYTGKTSISYHWAATDFFEDKDISDEELNKFLLEKSGEYGLENNLDLDSKIEAMEHGAEFRKAITKATKNRREHKHQTRKAGLLRYYYAKRCNILLDLPTGLDLRYYKQGEDKQNIGGDVGKNSKGNFLYYDKREGIKKFFDSENLDRRMQASYLIHFYDLILRHPVPTKNEACIASRNLVGLTLGAKVNHQHYEVEFSNEYLARTFCPNKDLSQVNDLRLQTMTFEIQERYLDYIAEAEIKLQKMRTSKKGSRLMDRSKDYQEKGVYMKEFKRLTYLIASTTTPFINGDELMSIPINDLANKGVAWAAPIRHGVQIMRDGVAPFLELIEAKGENNG